MTELAYVNGKILPLDEAFVPIEDRGYQFGDAVYEFIASYNGKLFALEEHLDRLENSLKALDFEPLDRSQIRGAILMTFERSGFQRAGLYLQISRGVAPRNHLFPTNPVPQLIITVRPAPEIPEDLRHKGASAITVKDLRWKRCDIKSVQLLPNALAKQQAVDAGADDAIFISSDGVVREGTSSNLFMVRKGVVQTHPLSSRILPGITREYLIDICREQGIRVSQTQFNKSDLSKADEVFLSGTVTEVLPVTFIDGQKIGEGRPGPIAKKLLILLRKKAGTN